PRHLGFCHRTGRALHRNDRCPPQGGVLGPLRRPPHPGGGDRRRQTRRPGHQRSSPGRWRCPHVLRRGGRAPNRPRTPLPRRRRQGPTGPPAAGTGRRTPRTATALPTPSRRGRSRAPEEGTPVREMNLVGLRRMPLADVPAVMELENALFPDDAWRQNTLLGELSEPSRHYVVAETDGEIIGYAGLRCVPPQGDVQTMAVARDHWGRGVGRALLTELL